MTGPAGYSPDDPVVAQYDRWQYPPPVQDLRDPSLTAYLQSFGRLELLEPIYWPAGAPRRDLDVLVAGCGTMAAACYAMLNPHCRVVGIDISKGALQHERRLKAHHQLDNLTLHECPIEQAASLGLSFDFIACQGVLHHMPDPTGGLRALGSVLRIDGVIAIMLYARYGRTGVYMLQEFFRILGLGQDEEGVAIVRQTLANLPPEHPARMYIQRATDLSQDAGLVDTFLHRRDQPFSVAQCLDLVSNAGLTFGRWDHNFFYYPEGPFHAATELCDRIAALPEEMIWQAMDVAYLPVGVHYFHVCRPDRDLARYRIPWEDASLLKCKPLISAKLLKAPGLPQGWTLVQPGRPPLPVPQAHAAVFSHIDGRRTVGECLAAAGIRGESAAVLDVARDMFRRAWRCGFAVLCW
ncbi:MAG TPA: methyltransferase domain-containing protein [Tepidisphaeraceae bacterium]|nr:methyltransferase domain-containing protein [Tepidisphaeraceae bacterium]